MRTLIVKTRNEIEMRMCLKEACYEKLHYESRQVKSQNLHFPMDIILKFFLMNC